MHNKNLEILISTERLKAFRGKSNNSLEELIHRYNYNISLCACFYAPLHIFEVAVRNSLSLELQDYLKDSNWLQNYKTHNLFQKREQDKIQEALNELKKKKRPLETGRIIAELNLGFWINLYDRPYMDFQINTIRSQFPYATNKQRDIFKIKERLQRIRLLRNRIFHYEPIWHWQDLDNYYFEIKETLQWISSDLYLKSFKEAEREFKSQFERQSSMLK